jgi:hypothetical protein
LTVPKGTSQEEKEYILKNTLNHLPVVDGSEGKMQVCINQKDGFSSCTLKGYYQDISAH